jgi:hypothetical protein
VILLSARAPDARTENYPLTHSANLLRNQGPWQINYECMAHTASDEYVVFTPSDDYG